ncbi:MAG: hypothetical protein HYR88_13885 [Verrucomicrobia bacterium]|nr:hypothetical protein [Verrucomicrobiota bacterium]MBI3869914.1 hypothetical protein [Verrucomicrobiota bacterium]
MKKIQRASILLIAILALAFSYVFLVPLRGGYLGKVDVSVRGYQTNALGQTQAILSVTNPGPHPLIVGTGIEIRSAGKWEDSSLIPHHRQLTLIGNDPALRPNTERTILVTVPQNNTPWRAFAFCQLTLAPDWKGRLAFLIETHVFKRRVAESFYTPELSPPHPTRN